MNKEDSKNLRHLAQLLAHIAGNCDLDKTIKVQSNTFEVTIKPISEELPEGVKKGYLHTLNTLAEDYTPAMCAYYFAQVSSVEDGRASLEYWLSKKGIEL
ncbi:MAG: hypothetical protein ACPGXY_03210 [Alphaproteobacteria bacterium]